MVKRFISGQTPEEPKQRVEELKQRQITTRLPRIRLQMSSISKVLLITAFVILVLAVVIIAMHHKDGPITQAVERQAGFPLFVPAPLPSGIVYKSKLASISQGIVNFSLQSKYGAITITEQAAPSEPPDLSAMDFQSQQVPAGTAYSGTSNGRPLTIISSNTTLIDIVAANNVPSELVFQVSRSLTLFNN